MVEGENPVFSAPLHAEMHQNLSVRQLNGMRLAAMQEAMFIRHVFNGGHVLPFFAVCSHVPAFNVGFCAVIKGIVRAETPSHIQKGTVQHAARPVRRGDGGFAHRTKAIAAILADAIGGTQICFLQAHCVDIAGVRFDQFGFGSFLGGRGLKPVCVALALKGGGVVKRGEDHLALAKAC